MKKTKPRPATQVATAKKLLLELDINNPYSPIEALRRQICLLLYLLDPGELMSTDPVDEFKDALLQHAKDMDRNIAEIITGVGDATKAIVPGGVRAVLDAAVLDAIDAEGGA